MTERLYLYALVRPDGQWGYVGATIDPKRRARNWAWLRPDARFQVLLIGAENYVLDAERKLIRLCKTRGIPITNRSVANTPLVKLRTAGRNGGLKRGRRKGSPISGRRLHELHPDNARQLGLKYGRKGALKSNHLHWHVQRGIINPKCPL